MKTVILGSGVMGVTTAWQLVKEGHEVCVVDRQPVAANETSFANAGLVAPGHALTWSSPRAPKILLKSLFRDDQALRLKLSADPRLWTWCLRFLRNCTSERARRNTLRKLKLCVYSQHQLQELVAETGSSTTAYAKACSTCIATRHRSRAASQTWQSCARPANAWKSLTAPASQPWSRPSRRAGPLWPAGCIARMTSRATRTSSPLVSRSG